MQSCKTGQATEAEAHIKKKYAEKVLSSLNWLRAHDLMCDLTLKVGSESFPVHSPVLAAASEYFFDLTKTKDSAAKQKAVIELKDLTPRVVRECIEFMYNGAAYITLDSVFEMLSASQVFKLEDLTELCLVFLSDNITSENCVKVKSVFDKYGYNTENDKLDALLSENSDHSTQTSGFLNQDKKSFERYLKSIQHDHELAWYSIKKWVSRDVLNHKQHYFELVSLTSDCFPAGFMLDPIWEDHLTKQSNKTKELIAHTVLNDIESFKDLLTLENCFIAKQMCEIMKHPNSNEAHGEVRLFIIKHFEELCDNDAILSLSKDEIFQVFRSPKTKYNSETVKWKVALAWVKHDLALRKQHFPHLLDCIKLQNMPLSFLQEEVRTEELMQQFDECKEKLLDAFAAIANPSNPTAQSAPTTPQSPKLSPSKRGRERKTGSISNNDVPTPALSFAPQQMEQTTPKKFLAPKSSGSVMTDSPVSSHRRRGRSNKSDAIESPNKSTVRSTSDTQTVSTSMNSPKKLMPLDRKRGNRVVTDSPTASPAKRVANKRTVTDIISSPAAKRRKQNVNVDDTTSHESVVSSPDKPCVAVFDPATGKVKGLDLVNVQWDVMACSKVAKDAYQGITSRKNKMYLLKGAELFAFDAIKKSWDKMPSKQNKPDKLSQMVVWEGNIYVLQNGHYDVFNITEEKWIEHKPFKSLGAGFCACVLMNDIYALGGELQPNRGIKYNILTESISDIKPLAIGRVHAAAVSLKNKVYVLGGTVNQELGASTECYDSVTDMWTTMTDMQMKRSHFSACAYDGNIYAVGGGLPHTGTMDTVEVYETGVRNNYKWRIFHRMLRMSDYASACIVGVPSNS